MRIGYVRGHVVLNPIIPQLTGVRFVVVEPITAENLPDLNGHGGGKCLIAVDQLSAAVGQIVGFTEGREAANPFWPDQAPVDAYCAIIVERVAYRPGTHSDERPEARK